MTGQDLLDTRSDPYARAAASANAQGQFLTFNRVGNFVAGQDKTKIPHGTRLIANMAGLRDGWRRWFGGRVDEDLTELVSAFPKFQSRSQLGDNDKSLWEKDDKGVPRDPWQRTYILEMADDQGTIYIYATQSNGGRNAISDLCRRYSDEYRMRPGMAAIITLGRDSYEHKTWGETYVPVFEIVGWTDADNPSTKGEADAGGALNSEHVAGQRAANPTPVEADEPSQVRQTSPIASTTKSHSESKTPTRF